MARYYYERCASCQEESNYHGFAGHEFRLNNSPSKALSVVCTIASACLYTSAWECSGFHAPLTVSNDK